jgi:hypothetical protein
MRLEPQTPVLIDHLRNKTIAVGLFQQDPKERHLKPRDEHRRGLFGVTISALMSADRYLYDSGNDTPVHALSITETALALIERDKFHLPRPVCIVEDYREETPSSRLLMLLREHDDCITIDSWSTVPDLGEMSPEQYKSLTKEQWQAITAKHHPVDYFVWCPIRLIIPFPSHSQFDGQMSWGMWAEHKLWFENADTANESAVRHFGAVAYAAKKFIVMLSSTGIVIEERRPKPILYGKNQREGVFRNRPYHYIRVPFGYEVNEDGTRKRHASQADNADAAPRKAHWVRGHIWGRNVRPIDQQRWYSPYFRGGIPDANPRVVKLKGSL